MKKTLFVLFCLPIIGFSQTYKNSIYNEDEVELDEGTKQPMCNEVEGLQTADALLIPSDYTGVIKECIDGKVIALANYERGYQNGLSRAWYENGQLESEYNYSVFSDNYEAEEDNSELNGLSREWYEDGQLKSVENYEHGYQDGLTRLWYENGQLKSEQEWTLVDTGNYGADGPEYGFEGHSELSGLSREWYEDGQLKSEGNYNDDEFDGLEREWYENGQLKLEREWNWKYYDSNNDFGEEDTDGYSELNGLSREWYENGQLESESNYKDGNLITKRCWDTNGNLIKC